MLCRPVCASICQSAAVRRAVVEIGTGRPCGTGSKAWQTPCCQARLPVTREVQDIAATNGWLANNSPETPSSTSRFNAGIRPASIKGCSTFQSAASHSTNNKRPAILGLGTIFLIVGFFFPRIQLIRPGLLPTWFITKL